MVTQDTLNHPPRKMRRIVRDTKVSAKLIESRFECPSCQRSIWRELEDGQRILCDGESVATVLPVTAQELGPPSPEELIDILREVLRVNLNPLLRLRIVAMVRRLKER